jgi:hypothetical protein
MRSKEVQFHGFNHLEMVSASLGMAKAPGLIAEHSFIT